MILLPPWSDTKHDSIVKDSDSGYARVYTHSQNPVPHDALWFMSINFPHIASKHYEAFVSRDSAKDAVDKKLKKIGYRITTQKLINLL